MSKVTTGRGSNPEVEVDSEVIAFRSQFEERSPLDQIVRDGAQRMLQQAIESADLPEHNLILTQLPAIF